MNDEPDDITREIFIAATPDTVFGFLIDPALIMKWIGISHQLEPRPGGIFRVEISAGNIARGIYTQVIRPHRVAFTWGWETHAADLTAPADLPPGAIDLRRSVQLWPFRQFLQIGPFEESLDIDLFFWTRQCTRRHRARPGSSYFDQSVAFKAHFILPRRCLKIARLHQFERPRVWMLLVDRKPR